MPTLRPAGPADLAALNDLMQASRAYDGAYRSILDGYAITEDQVARDHVILAESDDRVLGFYSLIVAGEPELDLMFVADAAQGTGLGALLFQDMRAAAKALGLARVRIVSHPPSTGFYERMGAVVVGAKPPAGRVGWTRPILELAP